MLDSVFADTAVLAVQCELARRPAETCNGHRAGRDRVINELQQQNVGVICCVDFSLVVNEMQVTFASEKFHF